MAILKFVGYLVVALIALVALLFLGARFSDGPLAIIPGGPLSSGDWVETPVGDWSFVAGVQEIEMQLEAQDTSRTVWIIAHEGGAFVPVSLAFPPGKSWHYAADEDGAAVLRIEGQRYRVNLDRVMDEGEMAAIDVSTAAKYTSTPPGDAGRWYFRVTSR